MIESLKILEITKIKMEKTKLPALSDLYSDIGLIEKQNQLNILLNAEPKKEWIKKHPFIKNLDYLPIERVEYLMTMIYSKWRLEIKDTKILANSIVSTVRVHMKDPITGEWDWQDGIGAIPIQVAKGSKATDFENMNSTAVQMGAPASESFGMKDACEKLGRIFGKDLNRKDTISYDRLYQMIGVNEAVNNPSLTKEIREEVQNTKTQAELKKVHNKHKGLGEEFDVLVVEQKKFLQGVKDDKNESA